jgi:DNA-binding MarR family transcriptional regulator
MALYPSRTQRPAPGGHTGVHNPGALYSATSLEQQGELLRRVRALIDERARRRGHFPTELFGEPSWDILLAMYAAEMAQQRLTASQIIEHATVPASTALRCLKMLDAAGLVVRNPDHLDARRTFPSLTAKATCAMTSFLSLGGARATT